VLAGQARVQQIALGHDPDEPFGGLPSGLSGNGNGALVGLEQPTNDIDGGGFACPIRP